MDPIATWGLIIASITGAGSVFAMGAWRAIGRVEGKWDRVANRLDAHSDKIDEHDRVLALLPGKVDKVQQDLRDLQTAIDQLVSTVSS